MKQNKEKKGMNKNNIEIKGPSPYRILNKSDITQLDCLLFITQNLLIILGE